MKGWCEVAASAGSDHMALEYVDQLSGSSARFACEARSSRADQRRKNRSLHELSQVLEEGVVAKSWMLSKLDEDCRIEKKGLTYLDVKKIIEKKLAHRKGGLLSESEISEAVSEFKDMRRQQELDVVVVAKEIKRLNDAMLRCNSGLMGSMSADKDTGRVRVFFGQLNNISTKAVREVKVKGMRYIEKRYDTDIHLYNEHGCQMKNMPKNENLDRWMGDYGKSKIVMAYNKNDVEYEGKHQPGGTAIRVTGAMTQYVRGRHEDFRKLGRYCSVVLWANP